MVTPLAPPGAKVMIHEKQSMYGTWVPHDMDGWCLSPVMYHYRCYKMWVWATNAEHVADTLAWLPTNIIMHFEPSSEAAIDATIKLSNAICLPSPSSPICPISHMPHHYKPTCATSTTCRHLPSAHTSSSHRHAIVSPGSSTRPTCVTMKQHATQSLTKTS
jgi:hypothetical protein